jgi:tripartite-type tricarboxylate transporter receptor subunit TctC
MNSNLRRCVQPRLGVMKWLGLSTAMLVATSVSAQNTSAATGQSYPEKPVRLVVPFPPGGAIDIMARHVTQKLGEAFAVQFLVDNRGGAGGAIGTENIARSAADGYSLLFSSTSPMSINPHINKVRYDPLASFTPVIMIGFAPEVLTVHPSLPVRTVKQLIAMAKVQPGALSFASSGVGTIIHVTAEMFAQRAGIKMLHVPYKGAAPAVIDTVAGNVTMLFAAYPSISGQTRVGKLKALAITSLKRLDIAPELPTVSEAALPGFESNQWWAVSGPAGMPASIVTRLNSELERILRSNDIRKRFAVDGAEPVGGTPGELAAYIKNDFEKWGAVIRSAGVKGE